MLKVWLPDNKINEHKQEYNTTLIRMKKAMDFMDGTASDKEKDKWLPEFKSIIDNLNDLIKEIGNMTDDEILEGFKG